jgi:hypothetical protein
MALPSTVDQMEGHVDVVATNGVHWGAQLVLITVLSHFLELWLELELLGSRYNADLMKDEMKALWIQTRRALESLSSGAPLSVGCGPPDSAGEE